MDFRDKSYNIISSLLSATILFLGMCVSLALYVLVLETVGDLAEIWYRPHVTVVLYIAIIISFLLSAKIALKKDIPPYLFMTNVLLCGTGAIAFVASLLFIAPFFF